MYAIQNPTHKYDQENILWVFKLKWPVLQDNCLLINAYIVFCFTFNSSFTHKMSIREFFSVILQYKICFWNVVKQQSDTGFRWQFHCGLFALKSCDKELQEEKKPKTQIKESNVTTHCSAPVYFWEGKDTTRFTGAKDQKWDLSKTKTRDNEGL